MSYRNRAVIVRYSRKHNVSLEVAEKHFQGMLAFLYLCGTSDEVFTPSEIIDEMWHTFLLFTKDYDRFCQKFFGKKIHHNPDTTISTESKEKNQKQYENMYKKAKEEFSDVIFDGSFAVCDSGGGDCGGSGACSSCGGGCSSNSSETNAVAFPNPKVLAAACGDCGHGGSCGGSTSCND